MNKRLCAFVLTIAMFAGLLPVCAEEPARVFNKKALGESYSLDLQTLSSDMESESPQPDREYNRRINLEEYNMNASSENVPSLMSGTTDVSSYSQYRKDYINSEAAYSLLSPKGKINYIGDNIGEEHIDPMTGNLIVRETDLVLPGIDGLDFKLERYYSLAEAELYSKTSTISGTKTYTMSAGEYIVTETAINRETGAETTSQYPCENYDDASRRQDEILSRNDYDNIYYYEAEMTACSGGERVTVINYSSDISSASYYSVRSNLGAGWSWGFPSVQMIKDDYNDALEEPEAIYFHNGNGTVLEVQYDYWNDYTFVNYVGGDIVFDDYIDSYGRKLYRVTDAENTEYRFGIYGELLLITDRYGNKITFEYTICNNYYGISKWPRLSKITDSVGRQISFSYLSQNGYDYINLTVTSPISSEEPLTLRYKKDLMIIENGYYLRSMEPILTSFTNSENETTTYYPANYEEDTAVYAERFNLSSKSFEASYMDYDGEYTTNFRYLLGGAIRPHSRTEYYYNPCIRNLGNSGIIETYRVVAREDYEVTVNQNNFVTYRYSKNYREYEYCGDIDYTGYPYFYSYESIGNSERWYAFYTNVKEFTPYDYNSRIAYSYFKIDGDLYLKQLTEQYYNQGEEMLEIASTVQDYSFKQPITTKISYYNANGYTYDSYQHNEYVEAENKAHGKPIIVSEEMSYDEYNSLERDKHQVEYDYDSETGYLLRKTWYQSDNSKFAEFYEYDAEGRVLKITKADASEINYSYEKNSDGKVIKKTTTTVNDGNTMITEENYTAATAYAFPTTVTKKVTSGQTTTSTTTTYTYNMLLGVITSETDSNGNTTYYEYDKLGRPTRIVYPKYSTYSSAENKNTEILPVEEITYETDSRTNDDLEWYNEILKCQKIRTTTAYYDVTDIDADIPTEEQLLSCNSLHNSDEINYYVGTGELIESRVYDNVNGTNEYVSTYYTYDTHYKRNTVVDANGNTTVINYDDLGRETKIVDIFDNWHITEYNKNGDGVGFKTLSYFVPADNRNTKENVVEYTNDRQQRVTKEKAYISYPESFVETKYTYDLAGNVIGIIDPNGNLNEDGYTESYSYDSLNRVISAKNANNEIISTAYDNCGNTTLQSMSDGKTLTSNLYRRSYDGEGKILSDKDNANNSNIYTYNNLGQLVESVDKDGKTYTAQYNEAGINDFRNFAKSATDYTKEKYQITTPFSPSKVFVTDENENPEEITSRVYSPTGKMLSESSEYTYNTGIENVYFEPSSSYKYDIYGNITSAEFSTAEQELSTQYTYNKNRLSQVSVGDTANVQYEFYADGKLKSVTYPTLTDGKVLKTEYEYDGLSRVSKLTNTKGTEVLSQYEYTYDNNGNILTTNETVGEQQNSITYTYDKLNRIATVSGTKGADSYYEYDYRGNRKANFEETNFLSEENAEFLYNEQNKLYYANVVNDTTNIEYSSNGYRYVKQINNDEPVFYIYDISGRLVAEAKAQTGGVVPVSHYVWGPDRVLAKIDKTNNTTYYYLYNGHGDVVQITDVSGVIKNTYDYDVWGNFISKHETIENPFTYFGQTYDETTGLYYLRARYYDPETGRFTQQDPAEDGYNWYVYGNQNPVVYVDYTGESVILTCVILGAVIGFTVGGVTGGVLSLNNYGYVKWQWVAGGALLGGVSGAFVGWGAGAVVAKFGVVATATNIIKGGGASFASFDALKKFLGSPGAGRQWHHIVEQCQAKTTRAGFSNLWINNTNNVVSVSEKVHQEISAYYSSIQSFTNGLTVRNWLNTQSFEEQFKFGIEVLKMFGVNIGE